MYVKQLGKCLIHSESFIGLLVIFLHKIKLGGEK